MQLRDLWVLIRSHQQPRAGIRGWGESRLGTWVLRAEPDLRLSLSERREPWLTPASSCDEVWGPDSISLSVIFESSCP
jgi:hypothetical protein